MALRVLNPNYDISKEDDLTLALTMKDLCESYNEARHEMSTGVLDVWNDIERVAQEIVNRKNNNVEKLGD